jgi:homoserine kinase type II
MAAACLTQCRNVGHKAAMAFLTDLDLPTARALGEVYGLSIARVEALAAGSVNSNFRLWTTTDEVYFARIYEEQASEGAAAEARLLWELSACGVCVAAPLQPKTDAIALAKGKPFAVYPWIAGEDLCHGRLLPENCATLGGALARVHLATPCLSCIPQGRFGVAELFGRLDFIEENSKAHAADASRIRAALTRHAAARNTALPSGLTHGDLFRDNVLWQGSSISALLDFESACRGPFLYDLMVCVLAWCYTSAFDLARVASLVAGYQAVRPLTSAERAAYVNEGALACLRFATTRITDFAMRTPPGDTPKRAYQRFLTRLEALEAGVLRPIFDKEFGEDSKS